MPLIRDLSPLILIHAGLWVVTVICGGGTWLTVDGAAFCVQLAWLLFLLPGWLAAPLWDRADRSLIGRYLACLIGSTAFHGLIACSGAFLGASMTAYQSAWTALTVVLLLVRIIRLGRVGTERQRVTRWDVALISTVAIVAACVYGIPRSNDIHQFILQQQDMLHNDTLVVSSIGMTAMDVTEPMPRWRAHYWHLLPSLLAKTSGVAVDQVLLRYATIPVAFSVLLSLSEIIRSLGRRRVSGALALLAILGPAFLWYRNYTAFNFSFRITNNFLLDKDFALFFLIPSTVWLVTQWVRGDRRCALPLLAMTPALIRFHPMTAVYLCLLLVPMSVFALLRSSGPSMTLRFRRLGVVTAGAIALFVVVVLIGDAQGNHEQIRQIIETDYANSLEGRPLHYWVGFYNAVEQEQLESDTTSWKQGRLQLKASLLIGCGLLLMAHLCCVILAARWLLASWKNVSISGNRKDEAALLGAGLLTLTMLWGMWLVSGMFLTAVPHYTAGYERLHWFSYTVAILVVAGTLTRLIPRSWKRAADGLAFALIIAVALFYASEHQTPLVMIKGINSLLDEELEASVRRRSEWAKIPPDRTLEELRPEWLQDSDRVLLLDAQATKHYWCTRQGTFWSDPYVEAFAWFHRGDEFLLDRAIYYALEDRRKDDLGGLKEWLNAKGVNWLVDDRPDAAPYFRHLKERYELPLRRVSAGVWRVESATGSSETKKGSPRADEDLIEPAL